MKDIDNENIQINLDIIDESTSEIDEAGMTTGIQDDKTILDPIKIPYNPEEISIDTKTIPIEKLFRLYCQGDINISPTFQRKFVWDMTKQSRLIESLILSIPLPMFYFSEDSKGILSVIDGLQRLNTILNFILGGNYKELPTKENLEKSPINGDGFKLTNLEYFKADCEGKIYSELPLNIKNRILQSDFIFTIVKPQTPPNVKFNIFNRINTGGLPLSPQEIRHAMYQGKSTELLENLSEETSFKQATDSSIKDDRMAARELILRFLSFLIRDKDSFDNTLPQLGDLLNITMLIINAIPNFQIPIEYHDYITDKIIETIIINDIEEIKTLFETAMERAYALFGNRAFRKSIDEETRRTPLNKSMFGVLSVKLAFMDNDDFNLLKDNHEKLKDLLDFAINRNTNPSTKLAFGTSASQQSGIILRFNVIDLITEIVLNKSISEKFKNMTELEEIISYASQDNS